MKKRCSLKLDLIRDGENWSWRIFHRTGSPNPSIDFKISMPKNISPSEILLSLNNTLDIPDIIKIRAWGNQIWNSIFPQSIMSEIESYTGGDILFYMPPEWANIPFELCYIPSKGFLGKIFQIGTIIRLQTENTVRKEKPPHNKMLIIADPAENLPSAHREGMHLKQFAKKSGLEIQLIASGQRSKILDAIKTSSIVHFAGHSFNMGNPHSTGWEIGPDMVLDLIAIEKIGEGLSVPWLIFSNSCHASNCGEGSNLSGIAGAFLKAGASQVVAPIRRVNDREALEFAKSFYKYLFTGITPAESSRAAKHEIQKRNPDSITHLLYRLFGDPRFNPKGGGPPIEEPKNGANCFRKLYKWTSIIIVIFILLFIVERRTLAFLIFCSENKYLKEFVESRTLTVYISLEEYELQVFERIAKQFGREHYLIIRIQNTSVDDILKRLHDKDKIDLVLIDINKRGDIQVEEELQDLFNETKTLIPSTVHPVLKEHLSDKEQRFFVPFRANVRLLFINRKRLNDFYGDLANWTWPDVFEIARKTKAGTGSARVFINGAGSDASLFLFELIRTAGGDPNNLCKDSSMEAMRFLRQLWPYVSAVNWQTATGALLAERAYMGRSWCITIRNIQDAGKLDSFEICSGLGWKNKSNLLGGDYMAMPKGALYPKRTLEFMHFLVSTEVQKKLAKELWWPPIRTDILRELERDDEYGPYFHQIKQALLDAKPVPAWWTPEISKIYSDLFTRITISKDSLNSLCAIYQEKINAIRKKKINTIQ